MPVRRMPVKGQAIATKKVTPPDLDPAEEWVEIPVLLENSVYIKARAEATSTTSSARGITEKIDNEALIDSILIQQIKAWRLLDPDAPEGDSFKEIPLAPSEVKVMPQSFKNWLYHEIDACTGIIPTQNLKVVTQSGVEATF